MLAYLCALALRRIPPDELADWIVDRVQHGRPLAGATEGVAIQTQDACAAYRVIR